MRLLVVCLVVVFLFAVGIVWAAIDDGGVDGDLGYTPLKVHAPGSDDERAAAAAGLAYATALERRDGRAACRFAADKAAGAMGCATARPGHRPCGEQLRAFHAKSEDDWVDVRVGSCILHVARRGGGWRVIEDVEPTHGYA